MTKLDRRGFLLTSVSAGAAVLLPSCQRDDDETPAATGEFDAPYTRDDPGQWVDKVEIHLPRIYGAKVDATRTRLWVEVQDITDPNAPLTHEMTTEHWIDQIVLRDDFRNNILTRAYAFDAEARLIATVELPEGITGIEALEHCNLHGWWRASYDVAQLAVAPVGDPRRAFTRDSPGQFGPQALAHTPVFGRRPNGSYSVEIGERNAGTLHPMDEGHYISSIMLFDQNDQLRAQATLGPGYQEPVADFPAAAIAGTARVRVLAYCNSYNWWEAEYSVS